jgi:hypothetical protein
MCKPGGPHLLIFESPTGGCNEAIYGRFINNGPFLVAFALYGPEITFMGQCDQVYPGITSTQIQFTWKLIP